MGKGVYGKRAVNNVQATMNDAWKNWDKPGADGQKMTRWGDFIKTLNTKQKIAVLIGNMNYQVGNGGWIQWRDNGFAKEGRAQAVVRYLKRYGGPASQQVIKILQDSGRIVRRGASGGMSANTSAADRDYSREYHKINDKMLAEIGNALSNMDDNGKMKWAK